MSQICTNAGRWELSPITPNHIKGHSFNGPPCFSQVGFSALGALALQPLMCYQHPNEQYSLLKYPNTFCGSDEHGLMLGLGIVSRQQFINYQLSH